MSVAPSELLSADGLVKVFGSLRAVDDMRLSVHAGEVVGVIGANGAGKSTLLNLISGVTRADRGRVVLAGMDVTEWTPEARARRGLLRTFQRPRLVAGLTAVENVMIGAQVRHARALDVLAFVRDRRHEGGLAAAAAEALALVEVPRDDWLKRADAIPPTEHRWLEVARAVAAQPVVALLDEPNSGFTAGETDRLVALLELLAEDRGVGIVLVTHDVSLAMRACDRITVMHHGRLLATGLPGDIVESEDVVKAYLGTRAAKVAQELLRAEHRA